MHNVYRLGYVMIGLAAASLLPAVAEGMCGYFSRPIITDIKQPSVLQPSQIAFITWDPAKKQETVTVQPRFEGDALDFGMVIPTPSQPKLHEMPRDFFKALGLMTQPKRRVQAESKLLPWLTRDEGFGAEMVRNAAPSGAGDGRAVADMPRPSTIKVLEVGLVGSLDYKIISAGRADDLFAWLKDNKYSYSGDEATLNFYVTKKYFFTVMKIDTLQMKKNKDGSYTGDVTPTRFSFASEELVYPLKITQVSVKDKTEALFYVQAPYKIDLSGDMSYQFQWLSLLKQVEEMLGPNELLEPNREWLHAIREKAPKLLHRGQELGYSFPLGQAAPANKQGHFPASLEWSKKLSADDIMMLGGDRPYGEVVPDPDWGFNVLDLRDPKRMNAVMKVIQHRVQKYRQDRPRGYLVRDASKEDLQQLALLKGHVQEGQVITKFSRTFTRDEMNDDLVLVQAKVGNVEDRSVHEELLRSVSFRGGRGRFPLQPVPPGLPRAVPRN